MFSYKTHRIIYCVLLTLLGGCMVCTHALSSLTWVLLAANWLLEGRWREKWEMMKQSPMLHAIAVFFLFHLVALLWSSNLEEGLRIAYSLLPFIVVALITLTTPTVTGIPRKAILSAYVGTVVVITFIGLVRWLTISDLPHREIVPYVSHIRFSLNCCMVIFLTCSMMRQAGKAMRWIGALTVVWMLFVLFMLRSYTGLGVLLFVSPVIIIHDRKYKWLALWGVAVVAIGVLTVAGCRSYYRLSPLAQEPLRPYTQNGRPYTHRQDGLIENGNYVYNYICSEELHNEWLRRTGTDVESISPSGYPVESVLIRYLNALGLTKDSVGVAALSDSQIEEIARGIENPVYTHGSQARKMLYVSLFEYENYRCHQAVEGFSMLQRLELWKSAIKVFMEHPWIGTGTGDMIDEMHRQQVSANSPMSGRNLTPHNEYLSVLVMFGAVGFLLIVALFVRAARQALRLKNGKRPHSPLMAAWSGTVLLSCLTENTPCSLVGGLFCSWFLAFREESKNGK